MKKCSTCQEEKQETEFNKNKSKKDGLNSVCKSCSRIRSRQYYEENKEKHKKAVRVRSMRIYAENKVNLLRYLLEHPCIDCGERNPVVLEFDHICDKKYSIGNMISGWQWETILKEIEKCEVRCANCHRIKTSKEFDWFKAKADENRTPVIRCSYGLEGQKH